MLFHPIFKDIHGPLYGEANFEHHDQPPPQASQPPSKCPSQHFESIFTSYEEIEATLWNNPPNTHEEINDRLDNLYAFKSMVDSHLHQAIEFQTTLLSSIANPPHFNKPPMFHHHHHNHQQMTQSYRILALGAHIVSRRQK